MINQLNGANQEVINLRIENERLQNDLNIEKKTNEIMMKSQENMNQLTEQTQHRHKEKTGSGYIE